MYHVAFSLRWCDFGLYRFALYVTMKSVKKGIRLVRFSANIHLVSVTKIEGNLTFICLKKAVV